MQIFFYIRPSHENILLHLIFESAQDASIYLSSMNYKFQKFVSLDSLFVGSMYTLTWLGHFPIRTQMDFRTSVALQYTVCQFYSQ
jgi:hypothetical protein